jgi:hypothetical protein
VGFLYTKIKGVIFMAEVYLTGGVSWLNDYAKTLSDGLAPSNNNVTRVSSKYYTDRDSEIYKKVAALSYRENIPDSVLEIALATYYTSAINIRPVEADRFLPANNPKQADLKLGKEVYQELQVLRFLGNTVSVDRYEGILKFITDRGNVSEADIKGFMRDGIRSTVETEFSKKGKEGVVPSEVYADWESRGFARDTSGRHVNGMELVIKTLTDFFLNPTQDNYVRVRGIVARIYGQDIVYDPLYNAVDKAIDNVTTSISPSLKQKLDSEFNVYSASVAYAKQPDDPAFKIFSIPYTVR